MMSVSSFSHSLEAFKVTLFFFYSTTTPWIGFTRKQRHHWWSNCSISWLHHPTRHLCTFLAHDETQSSRFPHLFSLVHHPRLELRLINVCKYNQRELLKLFFSFYLKEYRTIPDVNSMEVSRPQLFTLILKRIYVSFYFKQVIAFGVQESNIEIWMFHYLEDQISQVPYDHVDRFARRKVQTQRCGAALLATFPRKGSHPPLAVLQSDGVTAAEEGEDGC